MTNTQEIRTFVDTLLEYNQLVNSGNVSMIRRMNALNNYIAVYVISPLEPHDMLLPINCYWINSDQESTDFKTLRFRTSKQSTGSWVNTWEDPTTSPQSVWYPSKYDDNDSLDTNLEVADVDTLGTVTLSTAMSEIEPVVLEQTDPSLSDARVPTSHDDMHPEVPATSFVSATGDIDISRSIFADNKFLTINSEFTAGWKVPAMPVPGISILPDPDPYQESSIVSEQSVALDSVYKVEVLLV